MKRKMLIMIVLLLFPVYMTSGFCEDRNPFRIAADDEWSWETGAYNTFSGEVDLSECPDNELKINMSSDLTYEEDGQNHQPVFVVVNGDRITMLNQSNSATCIPDAEDPVFRFTGSLMLPEKEHVRSVTVQIMITDGSGTQIKTLTSTISTSDGQSRRTDSSFYIPFEITHITIAISLTAAVVWILVLIRQRQQKKKERSMTENADI